MGIVYLIACKLPDMEKYEIAAYAIQFEATLTIWIKVNDYNGKRAAYQRISYFLPPGRIRYKLHLVWANRNHYNALLNVPHDA